MEKKFIRVLKLVYLKAIQSMTESIMPQQLKEIVTLKKV